MDLHAHYENLYQQSVEHFKKETYHIDSLIDDTKDDRFGITLLIKPPLHIKEKMAELLNEFHKVDSKQYIYPINDIHITVMSIISCYSGFNLNRIKVEDYAKTIQKAVSGMQPFKINLKGLTASPSCIMIRGYFQDESLASIRNNLRESFKATDLESSIDKRYEIITAHATFFRIRQKLKDANLLLQKMDSFKYYHFGAFEVTKLQLVFNDWYQREKHVKKLHEFELG